MTGRIANARLVLREKGPAGLALAAYYALRIELAALTGRRVLRKRIHGCAMDLAVADRGLSRTLLLFGAREAEHRMLLERVLKPGMRVLDVGANLGYYVLLERRLVGPAGRVVAVEPVPENAALLRRNLALNGLDDVPVLEVAVSDRAGRRPLHLAAQSNLGTFHETGTGARHLTGLSIEVETRTLPGIAAEYGAPDLVRMDVEGHEVEVLAGLLPAVERGELAPMILFETHLSRYSPEHDLAVPLRRLFRTGYRTRLLASSGEAGSARLEALGYRGGPPIRTDFVRRRIFENVAEEDAVRLVSREGGVRAVLLAREP